MNNLQEELKNAKEELKGNYIDNFNVNNLVTKSIFCRQRTEIRKNCQ